MYHHEKVVTIGKIKKERFAPVVDARASTSAFFCFFYPPLEACKARSLQVIFTCSGHSDCVCALTLIHKNLRTHFKHGNWFVLKMNTPCFGDLKKEIIIFLNRSISMSL